MLSNQLYFSSKSISFQDPKKQITIFNNPNVNFNLRTKITCTKDEKITQNRHFVLVHGAYHGAWCWYKVSALLKSSGQNVTALDLAASGVNPKQVHEVHSFSDYFEPLIEFMSSLSEQERVVLVGHSISGIGISIAMEMFPQKISVGVFVAATMPSHDLSVKTIGQQYARKKSSFSKDNEYIYGNGPNNPPTAVVLGPNNMAENFYRFSAPEDLALATYLVRPFPVFSNTTNQKEMVFTKEKHGSVKRVFVICDEEDANEQKWMVENNLPDEVKVISGSDHMVMISKPQDLYSYLLEIGYKYL